MDGWMGTYCPYFAFGRVSCLLKCLTLLNSAVILDNFGLSDK